MHYRTLHTQTSCPIKHVDDVWFVLSDAFRCTYAFVHPLVVVCLWYLTLLPGSPSNRKTRACKYILPLMATTGATVHMGGYEGVCEALVRLLAGGARGSPASAMVFCVVVEVRAFLTLVRVP